MKTVAELSKELNISTQALYKKIKACNLTVASGGLKVDNHVTHITPQGEAILKGELQPKQPEVTNPATDLATNLATYLQEQIKIKDGLINSLQTELVIEREHSRTIALELATLAKQSQILQLTASRKPSFLNRIFGRKEVTKNE